MASCLTGPWRNCLTRDTEEGRDMDEALEVSALEVMLEAGQEVM